LILMLKINKMELQIYKIKNSNKSKLFRAIIVLDRSARKNKI